MRVIIIGGGPGGLYLAALLKRADPHHQVVVYERNPPDVTFGFGVVFSDATLQALEEADREIYQAITAHFAHWDDIDVHFRGEVFRSTGHGFAGQSRKRLLSVLRKFCVARGVELHFGETIEPEDLADLKADVIVAAEGLNSGIRTHLAEHFRPTVRNEKNRFVWLGTTKRFPAFTFYFKEDQHGLWRVHAYNYEDGRSTFIVEATESTWRAAGMDTATEEETAAFVDALFAKELAGHPILTNKSIWRQFPTVSCARWHHDNVVLLGDAVHTAHFSVGSGTKIAMEGAIALRDALVEHPDVATAFERYEASRREAVSSLQRAAAVSLAWFEEAERYFERLPATQFAFSLLTRSLRITHSNLALRDPEFVADVDRWFARQAAFASDTPVPEVVPPPMFTPFRLRGLLLKNRVVVSPMCQYMATDGTPNDWHLVHLGSRAVGGAALIFTEMTDVSAAGRISPGCTGMYTEQHVTAWQRIVDFVHGQSDAAICLQLGHAGRKGSTRLMWEGIDQPLPEGNWPLVSASPLPYFPHSQTPEALDRGGMDAVRQAFVQAAQKAERAGFDMLEIHMAHGYLLASFLSPITNQRDDAYGGDLDARMRFPMEVFAAVRAVWPDQKPISVRMSATDWIPGGFGADDAVRVAQALKAAGCDLLDISTGQTDPSSRPEYGRLYQTPFAEAVRHGAELAAMTVGNISSYEDVNSVLAAGRADLCAIARAHLYDPYWTRHAAFEQHHAEPWPDPYGVLDGYTPRCEWSPRGRRGSS